MRHRTLASRATSTAPRPHGAVRHVRGTALRVAGTTLAAGLAVTTVLAPAPASATGHAMKADLHRLRLCESGNNYRLNTGNGYYGAYQFSMSTWHGLGFGGRPDQASHHRQDSAAKVLHRRSGWSAWPACSRTAHLR